MNDHDETECAGECEILDAKFTWWDLAIAFFGFLSGLAQAFENSASYLLKSAVAASNRETSRTEFADSVRAGLEAIPVTGDES